ncbi:MAG: PGF-CTERM sorting domain-containing protein [Methanophagales archaeon ANME-1-THS]|nr:MAG: PGF-CTERM sorting domain-containing protein [Methanophagales archaeon ANME-1-THS]
MNCRDATIVTLLIGVILLLLIPSICAAVCPEGCFCATEEEAKKYGYVLCSKEICGYDQYKNPMYCYKKPSVSPSPTPVCPEGCTCVTEEEAKKYGYVLCQGIQKICGYDQYQKPLYCYQRPSVSPSPTPVCPEGCTCVTEEEAKKYGYVLCQGIQKICGYDQYQKPLYCYEKPVTVKECPTGCACLSKDEGYKRNLDFCTDAQGNLIRCEVIDAQQGIYKYCFRTVEEEKPSCPEGCVCLTAAEAKELGYELCKGEKIICGYDQSGNPMYCYQKPSATPTPTPVCGEGCVCLAVDEANKLGFALCRGEKIFCGYDEYQKPRYCYARTAPVAKAVPLESLSVEVVPENITAKPGDTVTYKIKVEWSPETWEGTMDLTIAITAFGFEKTFEYPSIPVTGAPPLVQQFPITIPDNAPPLVYKALVKQGFIFFSATDETNITLKVPGFEAVFAVAGLVAVAYLVRRRR